jgi:carbonic anhydrase/acetyltransferase-like protein (isoleucine patch superfamily)
MIRRWAVVAEGAVVRNGFEVPEEMIAVGVPAKILDITISENYKEDWLHFKVIYERLAGEVYPNTFREVPMEFKR